jgi:hypothetical protein
MLINSSLGYVLRLFARHGGVVLAQCVLFGESAADQQTVGDAHRGFVDLRR